MDIGAWLRGLGLERHEAAFRDNAIGADVLAELTERDLAEIGLPLGDRKRILKAISELASRDVARAPPPARDDAERRPITVMFCDLVGSTSLAAKLDAEDWRELVGAYLDEAAKAVAAVGGHVLKKLGDGLMALFGYPRAQENDAERAARAGLAILRALEDLNAKNVARGLPALAARIGLESGPVVVDSTGEVFGDAPNIAARVQSAAEPGTLLVTAGVQRQVAGLFVVEDKGPHELKGVPGRPVLYRLVRASGAGRRAGARALTPLIGREEELSLLSRRWERARAGEGQFVQIVGEPGLGKSRLIEEFRGRLAETPHTWVEWAASQLLQNTPLHPLAEWGRQRFVGEQRLADLETTLREVKLDPAEHAPLLAPLLDIPLSPGRAPGIAAEELRRRQLAAVVAWLMAGARTQALVLAFEDLHWADPTTLDLMKTLADRGAHAPLLILATSRPEFRAPWATRSHHGIISLVPLDRAQILKMVAAIAERHALANDVVEGVGDRTGGVPLFIEEVTRLMLEGGAQTIPPTLQQSLAARLDRLGEAREAAQIGAVLGREFSQALLATVSGLPESALDASLEKLADADLLFVEGIAPACVYRFKHALIQDAAYESLLKARRQTLHRRAAEALAAAADPQPELVAHHFTRSGQTELAIEWWGKAGDAALRRSAFQEAISHLGKAIEMVDQGRSEVVPGVLDGSLQQPLKLSLQTQLRRALSWGRGFTSKETIDAGEREQALAATISAEHERIDVVASRYIFAVASGDLSKGRALAEACIALAEKAYDLPRLASSHAGAGTACVFLGDLHNARAHFEEALRLHSPMWSPQDRQLFVIDGYLVALSGAGYTLFHLGEIAAGTKLLEDARSFAEVSGHLPTQMHQLIMDIRFEADRGEIDAALRQGERLYERAKTTEISSYMRVGDVYSSLAQARRGDFAGGIAACGRAIAARIGEHANFGLPLQLSLLAQLHIEYGDAGAASVRLDEALTFAELPGERLMAARLHRMRGDILANMQPTDISAVEDAYREAIAVARDQGARTFELRAALPLARLLQSNDRQVEAYDVLVPALEGFAPTPELPAIAEAQALLAELEQAEPVRTERRNHNIRAKYAQALMITEGHASDAAQAAFERIDESGRPGPPAERWPVLYGQWIQSTMKGDAPAALATAQKLLRDGEEAGLPGAAASALRQMSMSLWQLGRFAEARRRAERARDLYDERWAAEARAVTGADFLAGLEVYIALIIWPTGDIDDAYAHLEAAIARAETVDPVYTLVVVLALALSLMVTARRPAETLKLADRAIAAAADKGVGAWDLQIRLYRNWALGRLRDPLIGGTEVRVAWNDLRARGIEIYGDIAPGLLADLQAAAGAADDALATIAEGLRFCADTGLQRDLANLHTLRGDLLSARDPAAAEASYREAIAVAREQGARTFELQAALPLARLLRSASRPLEAHDALVPALEGFAPTPELPAIAEAQALLATLARDAEVAGVLQKRRTRASLHANYARAVMWDKGFASEEARVAFERASGAAAPAPDSPEFWPLLYGRFANALVRAEYAAALDAAEAYLREARQADSASHALNARRMLGAVKYELGEFAAARADLEAVAVGWDEDRDGALLSVTGADALCVAEAYLAPALVAMGEAAAGVAMIERSIRRAETRGDFGARAFALQFSIAVYEFCGRNDLVRERAEALASLATEKQTPFWELGARTALIWLRGLSGDAGAAREMRDAMAIRRERREGQGTPMNFCRLAELEIARGAFDEALEAVAEGLANTETTGGRCFNSRLLRVRGDALVLRDPAAAEGAYWEAIAVARSQGARAFALQAALSLAKLLQTNNRPLEAHDVLAPALEGFLAAPEVPAIGEAQALLEQLSRADEVASVLTRRRRRFELGAAYSEAVMWSKGHGAEETKAALDQLQEVAAQAGEFEADLPVYIGQWTRLWIRGELAAARRLAEGCLRRAEAAKQLAFANIARRQLGTTAVCEGAPEEADRLLEHALAAMETAPEGAPGRRFGVDNRVAALTNVALAKWLLGDAERARARMDEAQALAATSGDATSVIHANVWESIFEVHRNDPAAALRGAERAMALSREHGMPLYGRIAAINLHWARGRQSDPAAAANGLRAALDAFHRDGNRIVSPLSQGMLADLLSLAGDVEGALSWIESGLALARESGIGFADSYLHRLGGDILVARDAAAAEAAYARAIDVARAQRARTFELQAALPLARLLQSTSRSLEAHDALAPALEGFAPTPELPAIAEAQALTVALAETEAVKEATASRERRLRLQSGYSQVSSRLIK